MRLGWLPVPRAAGYRTYTRDAHRPYGPGIDVGLIPADGDGIVRAVVSGVSFDRAQYFAVTSYDDDGIESPFSNELVFKPALLCAALPIPGCRDPSAPGAASLSVSNPGGATRDRLRWKWKGGGTTPGNFGDPLVDTEYVLCIYDDFRGVASLAMSVPFQVGGTCGSNRPCWHQDGSRGFTYLDKSPATSGLMKLKLKQGGAGKATLQVTGKGAHLTLPDPAASTFFRQDPRVTVQLVNDAIPPVCWEAVYRPAARAHTATAFKDTSD